MMPFIKYANTFMDYRNASVWSSPEQLEKPKKFVEPTVEMDVYSFGMVLWEMFHERIPFDGDLTSAIEYVVTEDSRPKIAEEVDEIIAKIIRFCWQKNANLRPTFADVSAAMHTS